MSTGSNQLTIRGIPVDVIYKDIRNLHIGVYPPLGRVRVAAPLRLGDDQVRLAVIQRLPWIKRQREGLRQAVRQSKREMSTGESHYVWGLRHRLTVIETRGRTAVRLAGNRLEMQVRPDATAAERERALSEWYRAELRRALAEVAGRAEERTGLSPTRWIVRRMKTKWGSCSPKTGRISVNLELAKKHPLCLEYVVVHELAHLRERQHGQAFVQLMDTFMPTWRHHRADLNRAPLAHEEWLY
ncbi:MAG: M48 family metallopeptidase [Actinomycetota bacterium]|nr:M48 family metallopeptidase [Actinomycetota bacterium]